MSKMKYKKYMTNDEFLQWVETQIQDFKENDRKILFVSDGSNPDIETTLIPTFLPNGYPIFTPCYHYDYIVYRNRNLTIIINTKTGKTAIARKNPNDYADSSIGLAIAWARYQNRPIPIVIEK